MQRIRRVQHCAYKLHAPMSTGGLLYCKAGIDVQGTCTWPFVHASIVETCRHPAVVNDCISRKSGSRRAGCLEADFERVSGYDRCRKHMRLHWLTVTRKV